jgi:uncharacterized protein with GYD domain
MFMNSSFWIVPLFIKSQVRSLRMRAGLENKGAELVIASTAEVFGTYTFVSVVQNEVPGAIKEVAITVAAGGSQSYEITTSPFNAAPAAQKKEFTAAEKTACSIEAMRNGGEYEACQ